MNLKKVIFQSIDEQPKEQWGNKLKKSTDVDWRGTEEPKAG